MIRALTASGDYYKATKEKWEEYHQAWRDEDMPKVMYLETGQDPEFQYDQD
jgi:hypothetical protein